MNNFYQDNKSRYKYFSGISILCLVFFILDRIFKYLALANVISWHKNFGIAFSINVPEKLFLPFYILVFLILFFLIWQLIKSIKKNYWLLVTSYWLLILGAISNLIDRLKFGYIIDYINFILFYNNLADIMICVGVIVLTLHFLLIKRDKICHKRG